MNEYQLPDARWPNVDLVGEYYRQSTIVRLIGGKPKADETKEADVLVQLVPEPDNPFSKSGNSISARIDGQLVGYIESAAADGWIDEINRITASGAIATTAGHVYAYNRTRYNYETGKSRYDLQVNIRVAIPAPGMLVPMNSNSIGGISILPWGNSLQVTGEENYLTHLFEYVPASGQGLVLLTMHKLERTLKNGTIREVVEVRLDNETVGQLTPASSQHFLPTIRHAADMGKTVGIWSKLKGSGLAVELTVHGARATELTDEWLRSMPPASELIPESDHYDVPDAYTEPVTNKSVQAVKTQPSAPLLATPLSTDASSVPAKTPVKFSLIEDGIRYEFIGGPTDEARVQVGKKLVTITSAQRKHPPKMYRIAGVFAVIALVIIGSLLAAIPGVGPILCLGSIALSVFINIAQRRIAKALENEQRVASRHT